jgi:ribosomal protein S27E
MAILCGACKFPVSADSWNREAGVRCPGCGHTVQAFVFPAIERTRAGASPEKIAGDSEASCFFHPESRAAVPCAECGRFLCNLCDIELDGRHLCTTCFQSGVSTNKIETLEGQRTMYDTIALALATLPALLFWPALVSAPAALYVVVRRWKTPLSILPRTRTRYVLAALFALAEIVFIGVIIWTLAQAPRPRVVSR